MTDTAASTRADAILIMDFGTPLTQPIARLQRETGGECYMHPFQSAGNACGTLKPRCVSFGSGRGSV